MKKVFIGACVVSMFSLSMAQHLEIDVDGGYGLGVGTSLVGKNFETDSMWALTKYKEVYASGGAGIKMTGKVTYFFNENIGVMVASGYSMLGKCATESIQPFDTTQDTTTSSYLPINIGVKFKAKMGKIEPYLYLAPGMYFPKKISTAIHKTPVIQDTTKTTYYYALGWGVSAGIGAVIMVSEKVGINLEITPTYAFAKQTKYEKEQGGNKLTFIFKDNTAQLPNLTYNLHDAPRDSYSSVAVKAGVSFKVF